MLLASCFFFFNDTATTEIYTLSLHDALPICCRRRRRWRSGRKGRIEPAGMDAGIERVGRLLVLLVDIALAHNAAETDLHMLAGAAEPIVQFEVTERRVQVVLPHQADRTLAEPD